MGPNPQTTSSDGPTFPVVPTPPLLEEILLDSVGVIVGTVTEIDDTSACVAIEEVLAGDPTLPSSGTIRVAIGPCVELGASGTWILGGGDPYEVLSAPAITDEVGTRRLLAGKPRVEPPPTPSEIRALAERADAVLFARIDATSSTTATATLEEAIHGESPTDAAVARGIGLDWTFPERAPSYGVLFLQHDDAGWIAINDQVPSAYRTRPVREALG